MSETDATSWRVLIKIILDRKLQILRKSVIQTRDKNVAKEQILCKN